jgi:hypothetical protein
VYVEELCNLKCIGYYYEGELMLGLFEDKGVEETTMLENW